MGERPSFGGEEFLKKKYGLHASEEVEEQASRTEKRTNEKVPQKPQERIRNYLSRFEEILERPSEDDLGPDEEFAPTKERGIEALKRILHKEHVIKPEDVPESYFELQKRIAREQGRGDAAITQEQRDQHIEVVIADQEDSLDEWVDYFASPDATYPTWLKYWVTRSVLDMGEYDKEKHAFTKRAKGTVKPFPEIDREALAVVLDAVEKKAKKEQVTLPDLEGPAQAEFQKLLDAADFAKLYAFAMEELGTGLTEEALQETRGEWRTYAQGEDPTALVDSLRGHRTGWCTRGESTAAIQLKGGDFHVYYSLDEEGNPANPRAAIRMEGGHIAEVRGIAEKQNLDLFIGDVVGKKMAEFPDGEQYEKKAEDMKLLTAIEKKTQTNQKLTKEELVFLYELNGTIEGFGYDCDPRVKEIRSKRNSKEDVLILFDCEPREIAWNPKDITPGTKVYVGPLFTGVFTLDTIEHLFTSFPEGKIERRSIEIGGKTPKEYEKELAKEGFSINDSTKELLAKMPISKAMHEIETVRLTIADLGFTKHASHDEVCKRAKELGLELSPAEIGPVLRLALRDQPIGDRFRVAMEPLTGRDGEPVLFGVGRYATGAWLWEEDGEPGLSWRPETSYMFTVRKP